MLFWFIVGYLLISLFVCLTIMDEYVHALDEVEEMKSVPENWMKTIWTILAIFGGLIWPYFAVMYIKDLFCR